MSLFDPPAAAVAPSRPAVARGGPTGEDLKAAGMAAAAESKEGQLGYAREVAFDVARGVLPHADGRTEADGLCTADDVAAVLESEGRPSLGNAAGSLFRCGWTWTGEFVKSVRPQAHVNLLRVWRLDEGARA